MLKVANSVIDASRITGVLPVANGGTGVTTSTGTGNTVLSAAPTLSGNVNLSTGNLVIGTSGKGVDFSVTSEAAGMTSELFADYEEGTWTPTLGADSVGGTQTYSFQKGTYTKIGNTVFIRFAFVISVKDATTAGNLVLQGLPFASNANGGLSHGTCSLRQNFTLDVGYYVAQVQATNSSSSFYFIQTGATAATINNISASAFAAGLQIIGQISYYV